MNKTPTFIKLLLAVILVLGIVMVQQPPMATAEIAKQEDPTNLVHIDITYDPGTKTYSMGGFSAEELRQVGAPQFQDEIWQVLGMLNNATLKIQDDMIDVFTDEQQLFSLAWDGPSREILYSLLNAYIELGDVDMERAEAWLDKADIVISLRQSKELSEPLEIALATLVQVKVAKNGELTVEGFPTGMSLTPETLALVDAANVENLKLCWNKGVVDLQVNGQMLPQATLFQGGLSVIDKAFGLNLGDLTPIFGSSFGIKEKRPFNGRRAAPARLGTALRVPEFPWVPLATALRMPQYPKAQLRKFLVLPPS